MNRKLACLLFLGLSLSSCDFISFTRRQSDDEILLQQEVRGYYTEVEQAFAAGNPQALASLFSSDITHPMTQPEILAWGQKFFAANKNAHFKIEKLTIDEISYIRAVVTLTYKVETPSGKGDFAGTEIDTLAKQHGHWYVASWDKVVPLK